MRTTLTIDDDILKAAKALALSQNQPIGKVLGNLARKGLQATSSGNRKRNGLPLFAVSAEASPITAEDVRKLEDMV